MDGVSSEDMDCLAFGTKHLIRGLKNNSKNLEIIDWEKMLNYLDITQE